MTFQVKGFSRGWRLVAAYFRLDNSASLVASGLTFTITEPATNTFLFRAASGIVPIANDSHIIWSEGAGSSVNTIGAGVVALQQSYPSIWFYEDANITAGPIGGDATTAIINGQLVLEY